MRVFSRFRGLLVVPILAGATACASGFGPTTQFGQNTVRYDRFDFQVLETEHFDIYYYEEEREAVREAGRMAERWYARLSRLLNHELRGRQAIVLYASHPHFRQTSTIGGAPGEGTGGVTEAFKRRIVLPFTGPLKETDHVLGHELVHAFQFDMTGSGGTVTQRNFPRVLQLPLWFVEGMAEYLSVGATDPHTAMWVRDAAANDRLPTMSQLRSPRFFPYRFGQAFWAYIAGRWGDATVGQILNAAARVGSAEAAIEQVLRIPADSVNAAWQEEIMIAFGVAERDSSKGAAKVVLSAEGNLGLNSAPALSADGKEIVFFSVRDTYSIDLFRADATTGEIKNKVVERAADPHYESIQFINSAGEWAPSGTEFVLGGITGSDPVLTVVDATNGELVWERVFPEIGEILNPTWSPDGQRIAFSGIIGGLSDLFVYHRELDSLERITDDYYADLQPAWSPDGEYIAFVTDRFNTDLAALDYGDYRLALMNVGTAMIETVPATPDAKHINPRWSPNGDLYFLSDRSGVTNVYRVEKGTGELYQLTDLYTGVTGITALSPALSSAAAANRIAFSVYENGKYEIYTMESAEALRGTPVALP